MSIKATTQIGNLILKAENKPIENIDSRETKELIQDLTDTMIDAGLVGISAPQIGVNKMLE